MRYITSFILLFIVSLTFAQERATVPGLIDHRKQRQAAAEKNIIALKEGVLLVRLNFQKQKIAYFEKYNNTKEVAKIKEKALKVNTEIIDAFNTYFKFCKVYFFAMDDSRKVLDGKLDEVSFYNKDGVEDPSIKYTGDNFFVGEFGYIEQDTTSYYKGSTPSTNNDKDPEGKTYYGGSKNNKSAFVIRDRNFIQLRDPFPYYVGYKYFGTLKSRYRSPIRKLNEKLVSYLSKF